MSDASASVLRQLRSHRHAVAQIPRDGDQADADQARPPISTVGVHVSQPPRFLGGLHIPVCSCGQVGMPCDRLRDAQRWVCYYAEADEFARSATRILRGLEADAQFGEVRR